MEVSQEYTYPDATFSVPEGVLDSMILPRQQTLHADLSGRTGGSVSGRPIGHSNKRSWVKSKSELDDSGKHETLNPPPYSLEVNPVEHLCDELREK